MYECMNRKMMNSKNLGARSMKNGALDRKIWLWKLSRVKRSLQEVLVGGYILSGWEALTQKNRGSCGVWEIFRDFCGFLKRLEWFRT
jgi:hypothetical protein